MEVRVQLAERSYSICIELGLLRGTSRRVESSTASAHKAADWIRNVQAPGRIAVISDRTVAGLFSKTVLDSFRAAGRDASLFTVPDGESSKSLGQAEKLYAELIRFGLKRDGLVVALGGGVVGDLAGFVAATYLRGVAFVQIPTTLLAQVDSSVGGKVGVNHALGKNLIGSFHQPKLVIMDPLVLETLPMRERWSGAAEVVKYALIRDADLFSLLEKELETLMRLENMDRVSEVLSACCRIKADIVEKDERESGLRRLLNFGHTFGHALEAATGYEMFRHGEAVAYGMLWAVQVSRELGMLAESSFKRADALVRRFPLPPIPSTVKTEDLIRAVALDKKQTASGLHLVLLEDIGRGLSMPVKDMDFANSIKRILNR